MNSYSFMPLYRQFSWQWQLLDTRKLIPQNTKNKQLSWINHKSSRTNCLLFQQGHHWWWWWWWWWWWIVVVVWLTDERRLALFPAGTNVRDLHHCESKTRQAGFESAQNLSSGLVEWSSAVVITTTPRSLVCLWLKYWSSLGQLKLPFSKTLKTRLFILPK